MTSAVERLPQTVLFLVNPLLLFPFVTDQALIRWLLVAASLAVAVAASAPLASRMWSFRREVWPAAALCLVIVYHLGRGGPMAEGARWFVMIALGCLTYLYCRTLDASERDGSLGLMVMAGGAVGAYAICQAAGWDVVPYAAESWMYRVVTTFGHRNFTAAFLVVVVLCGLWLVSTRRAPESWWFLMSVGLAYLGLLATGSRFPILAATSALVVFAGRGKRLRWFVVAGVAACTVWLLLIVARGEVSSIITRSETFILRAELYRSMVPLTTADPVFGLGPGGFPRAIPEIVGGRLPEGVPGLVFLHAHLLPAELLIDFGVIGLVLAALFVLPVWVGCCRRGVASMGWLCWTHVCWLVINLYDVSFFGYAGWVTLWPLLAFMRSENEPREAEASAATGSIGWGRRGVMAAVLVGVAFALAPMARASHSSFRGAAALAADRADGAVSAFEKARAIWPLPINERYQSAVAVLKSGRTERAVEDLLEIEWEAPGFSAVRYNLAMAYARLGRLPEATFWNGRHLELYPGDPAALEAGARIDERLGDPPR